MFILYDFLYFILAIIYLPIYLFRGKFHKGFAQRLGFLPKFNDLNNPIWVHAVSVGEAMVAKMLIQRLRQICPDKKFVISTVTPTGNKIAQSIVGQGDLLLYLPLDFSFIVTGVLSRIKPEAFIMIETEIWPNLIGSLHKLNIPVLIANGRLSDASFKGYSRIRFLVEPVLNKMGIFCVQTEVDALRFKALGVAQEKMHITGSMKFDQDFTFDVKKTAFEYRKKLGLNDQELFLVCGSTHPGEEDLLLDIFSRLLEKYKNLRLLLAMRHPERAKDLTTLVLEKGFIPQRITELPGSKVLDKKPVFILDTIGMLLNFYAASDIVFVGGSLVKKGGHNILEPAALGKPVIVGVNMFNFRDTTEMFLRENALILAGDSADLELKLGNLIENKEARSSLALRAKDLFLKNRGAADRTAALIKKIIKNGR
jgi:3-deoxy-D-manno-octulosonic-acid transferase